MKRIGKKLIPFITALLLLILCGTLSKAENAECFERNRQKLLCAKISAGSGSPDDIPLV